MDKFLDRLQGLALDGPAFQFEKIVKEKIEFFNTEKNELIRKFSNFYNELPDLKTAHKNLSSDAVEVGLAKELNDYSFEKFHTALKNFIPWRKGPFKLFGVDIKTEWASNLKWDRFSKNLDFTGKKILDIGSSNGYYMFRMANEEPDFILGVEPFIPYYFQFKVIQKYLNLPNIFSLPCFFDDIPDIKNFYDLVFCMGVLYHRKSPLEMLSKIRKNMAVGGVLILENLIIENDESICLVPSGRYAKMKNVYFIPSIKTLEIWLKKSGFKNMEVLDISYTTIEEQRKTDWAFAESLEDFLNSEDPSRTIEGYPAPLRAVVKAYV